MVIRSFNSDKETDEIINNEQIPPKQFSKWLNSNIKKAKNLQKEIEISQKLVRSKGKVKGVMLT